MHVLVHNSKSAGQCDLLDLQIPFLGPTFRDISRLYLCWPVHTIICTCTIFGPRTLIGEWILNAGHHNTVGWVPDLKTPCISFLPITITSQAPNFPSSKILPFPSSPILHAAFSSMAFLHTRIAVAGSRFKEGNKKLETSRPVSYLHHHIPDHMIEEY